MKSIDKIPTGKIQRASKLLQTGAKIGANYIKYYGDKIINSEEEAKEKLNQNNAEDIYNSLKELKGSALKVAQMLSMDKSILPQAYVEKFSLAQFQVPPLSPALVQKTFKNNFGKTPNEVFDTFSSQSHHAASIGQVHKATSKGAHLAVKIQYPGVADSISSDLAIVKPIAIKMFNIQGKDSDKYFKEVENKLLEETNYLNELEQGVKMANACAHIPKLVIPKYYPEFSSEKIITMQWMEGLHLSEFTKINTNKLLANELGQTLWDFYMFQIHHLRNVHADPHPGNFLVSNQNELIALDFGCMKAIPKEFYIPYFELTLPENLQNRDNFRKKLYELEILTANDTPSELIYFEEMFHELLSLFTLPFQRDAFDFSDKAFFGEISAMGERYAKSSELRKMNGNRGSKHFIYMNRTFFGLYNLLFDLKSNQIVTHNYKKYINSID